MKHQTNKAEFKKEHGYKKIYSLTEQGEYVSYA